MVVQPATHAHRTHLLHSASLYSALHIAYFPLCVTSASLLVTSLLRSHLTHIRPLRSVPHYSLSSSPCPAQPQVHIRITLPLRNHPTPLQDSRHVSLPLYVCSAFFSSSSTSQPRPGYYPPSRHVAYLSRTLSSAVGRSSIPQHNRTITTHHHNTTAKSCPRLPSPRSESGAQHPRVTAASTSSSTSRGATAGRTMSAAAARRVQPGPPAGGRVGHPPSTMSILAENSFRASQIRKKWQKMGHSVIETILNPPSGTFPPLNSDLS